MDKTMYIVLNLAYTFAKFFFVMTWVYATWVIIMGGEITIMIGENGTRFGFEGLVPSVIKVTNSIGGLFK